MLQDKKDDYPFLPGFKTGGASEAAAKSVEPITGDLRQRVYSEIVRGEGTADEIASRLKISLLSVRPRVAELVKLGRIEDSGKQRPNTSGRKATVWKAR